MSQLEKNMNKPLVVIITGVSGVGKTTLQCSLNEKHGFINSISYTTRAKRGEEIDGKHYHFVSKSKFKKLVSKGNYFLEWSEVYGNLYGVPTFPIFEAVTAGKRMLLVIDVQGHDKIVNNSPSWLFPHLKSILLEPPSSKEIEERLNRRGDTSEVQIKRRLEAAKPEAAYSGGVDCRIVALTPAHTLAVAERFLGRFL